MRFRKLSSWKHFLLAGFLVKFTGQSIWRAQSLTLLSYEEHQRGWRTSVLPTSQVKLFILAALHMCISSAFSYHSFWWESQWQQVRPYMFFHGHSLFMIFQTIWKTNPPTPKKRKACPGSFFPRTPTQRGMPRTAVQVAHTHTHACVSGKHILVGTSHTCPHAHAHTIYTSQNEGLHPTSRGAYVHMWSSAPFPILLLVPFEYGSWVNWFP